MPLRYDFDSNSDFRKASEQAGAKPKPKPEPKPSSPGQATGPSGRSGDPGIRQAVENAMDPRNWMERPVGQAFDRARQAYERDKAEKQSLLMDAFRRAIFPLVIQDQFDGQSWWRRPWSPYPSFPISHEEYVDSIKSDFDRAPSMATLDDMLLRRTPHSPEADAAERRLLASELREEMREAAREAGTPYYGRIPF